MDDVGAVGSGYSFQGPPIREAPEGVLFSEDTHGLHNDLWLLNSTWQWQTMAVTQGSSLPPPRAHHAATYDAASNVSESRRAGCGTVSLRSFRHLVLSRSRSA